LSAEELELLDEFGKLVQPLDLGPTSEARATEVTEHMCSLLEVSSTPVQWPAQSPLAQQPRTVLLTDVKAFFERVSTADYWDKALQAQLIADAAVAAAAEDELSFSYDAFLAKYTDLLSLEGQSSKL
jgi:hypothetical protein